ncbi:hypothetical protein QE152_g6698 [Popillia japonica]|uniref:Gustatory receptor n=1 Tax=Popillia japonica TaxID=7064 RepID=A0AAW1MHP6_POPJA
MQELNKLLGTEKKQYPLINYAFLRSIACLLIMELCLFTAALNAIADKIKGSSGGHVSNYLGITMILLKIYTIWLLLEENKQQYSILNGQILNLPRSITRWNIKEKIGHLSKLIKLYRTLTKFSMSLNEFFARIISVEIIQMFILIIWTLDGLFVSLSCFVNGIGSDFNSMVAVILSRVIFGILYLQYNIRKWINIADEVSNIFGCIFFSADDKPVYTNIILALPIQIMYAATMTYHLYHMKEQRYSSTKVLQSSNIIFMGLVLINSIYKPIYYLIRRTQHRRAILKMQQHNKLLNFQQKEYYRVNYSFLKFIIMLITLTTATAILSYKAISAKIEAGSAGVISMTTTFLVTCIDNYIIFLILKEKRWQFRVLNQKFIEISQKGIRSSRKETIKSTSELVEIYHRLTGTAIRFNSLLTPILLLNLLILTMIVVYMADLAFVIVRTFLNERTIEINLTMACFVRIGMCSLYLQLILRIWIRIVEEVGVIMIG